MSKTSFWHGGNQRARLRQVSGVTVMNCVNTSKHPNGDHEATKAAREWKESEQFSGYIVENESDIKRQHESFFTQGKFIGEKTSVIFNSKFIKYVPYGPGMYCVVKRGSTQPQ